MKLDYLFLGEGSVGIVVVENGRVSLGRKISVALHSMFFSLKGILLKADRIIDLLNSYGKC